MKTMDSDDKILILAKIAWRDRGLDRPAIDKWLSNFEATDQDLALTTLTNFCYFGQNEIRSLVKSLFLDFIIDCIKHDLRNDIPLLTGEQFNDEIKRHLKLAAIIPLGPPGKSAHLLSYFLNQAAASTGFDIEIVTEEKYLANSISYERVFLFDDICGTGHQARDYFNQHIKPALEKKDVPEIHYCVLFGVAEGMQYLQAECPKITTVNCVTILSDRHRLFSSDGVFSFDPAPIDMAKALCEKYGTKISTDSEHILGYKGGQLGMGFSYNTPDNSLPIFWSKNNWSPIFTRHY